MSSPASYKVFNSKNSKKLFSIFHSLIKENMLPANSIFDFCQLIHCQTHCVGLIVEKQVFLLIISISSVNINYFIERKRIILKFDTLNSTFKHKIIIYQIIILTNGLLLI